MKTKQPARDFTGMFAPATSGIVYVLSYEMPSDSGECQMYVNFLAKAGGFDPWNVKLTPMKWNEDHIVDMYLDSMTGACENGLLSQTEWPSQLFASPDDLEAFLEALETHQDRFGDRHHRMLENLTVGCAELLVTGEQAAEGLRDALEYLAQA
jgi:hypothetical protein